MKKQHYFLNKVFTLKDMQKIRLFCQKYGIAELKIRNADKHWKYVGINFYYFARGNGGIIAITYRQHLAFGGEVFNSVDGILNQYRLKIIKEKLNK